MSARRTAVLRPGDWVIFDGGEHQVVGFAGTSVRLRSAAGAEQVVLGAYLMASAGFAVIDSAPRPEIEGAGGPARDTRLGGDRAGGRAAGCRSPGTGRG